MSFVQKKDIVREMIAASGKTFIETVNNTETSDRKTEAAYESFGKVRDWSTVMADRISFRHFNVDEYVKEEDLLQILKSNATYYNNQWGDSLMEQYLIAGRTRNRMGTALENRTIYRYDTSNQQLVASGSIPNHIGHAELYLQREFAEAAVVIFFVGALEQTLHSQSVSGYNHLLVKAGAIAHHSWLCSMTYGYSGTVFAGVLPKSLRKYTDVDGYRKCQLFAFAFG